MWTSQRLAAIKENKMNKENTCQCTQYKAEIDRLNNRIKDLEGQLDNNAHNNGDNAHNIERKVNRSFERGNRSFRPGDTLYG